MLSRSQNARRIRLSLVVAAAGFSLALLRCFTAPTEMRRDAFALVATAFVGAAAPGLIGWLVLRALGSRSVQTQTMVVSLVSVVGTISGVLLASRQMFLSRHDLDVLVVVSIAAATVGVLAALNLGDRVGRATANLAEAARRIGVGEGGGVELSRAAVPEEFAALGRELADMEGRLQASEGARRELVAWVSHDLRTPLAGIRVIVEALEDGVVDDPETVQRYYRTVREHVDRVASLVDDLFELSRLQTGALRLVREPVPLADLVSDALAGASVGAAAKRVELSGDVDTPGAVVAVSARELGRVLQNLLHNAVRHTPEGGSVHVAATVVAGDVTIVVQDDGGGINPADLGRIFEVGYTADTARTAGGTGLGLAIARGFVEAHGGHLSASNERGGACFRVVLPGVLASPRPADAVRLDDGALR